MLVLTRKRREEIVIGGDIVVTVLEIKGGGVRLGIEAPRDVPVHRKEIHEALKDERASNPRTRATRDSVGSYSR